MSFIRSRVKLFVFLLVGLVANGHAGSLVPTLQKGHSAPIFALDITRDGKYAASGGSGQVIKIWELNTGREVRVLEGHAGVINDIKITPDSRFVLSTEKMDNRIWLWDFTSGELLRTYEATINGGKIAVSNNQQYILTSTAQLLNLETGMLIRTIGDGRLGMAMAFSPDDSMVAMGFMGGEIQVFSINTGDRLFTIAHKKSVTSLVFSSDGTQLLSGSYDGSAVLWSVASHTLIHRWQTRGNGEPIKLMNRPSEILDVMFSHDEKYCFTAGRGKQVDVWDRNTGEWLRTIKTGYIVDKMALQRNPNYILTVSRDIALDQWHPITGRLVKSLQQRSSREQKIITDKKGRLAFTISNNRNITIWNLEDGTIISTWASGSGYLTDIALSDNNRWLIATSSSKEVFIWDINSGIRRELNEHKAAVTGARFANHDRNIISMAADGEIISWDMMSGNVIEKHAVGEALLSIEISSSSKVLATGGNSGSAHIWDVDAAGRLKSRVNLKHKEAVLALDFSPDAEVLYTSSINKIRSFDLKKNKLIRPSINTESARFTSAFSSDGRYIAVGSIQSTISKTNGNASALSILDARARELIYSIEDYRGTIANIRFHPAKPQLLISFSGGLDIYDLESRQVIATLTTSKDGESTVVTPDGYYNSSAEGSGLIYLVNQENKQSYELFQYESLLKKPRIIRARLNGDFTAGVPAPMLNEPPVLSIVSHGGDEGNNSQIMISVKSKRIVSDIKLFVNGSPFSSYPINKKEKKLIIDLSQIEGDARIAMYAFNSDVIASKPLYINRYSPEASEYNGVLHVLAIGIDDYRYLPEWSLDFSATDAKSFAVAMEDSVGKQFSKVETTLLINKNATQSNIADELERLSMLSANDMAVILMAGHGVQSGDDDYYLLTHDTKDVYQAGLDQAIDWGLIRKALNSSAAKVLLFLDTCHSASITREVVVTNGILASSLFSDQRSGNLIFSASKGRQESNESDEFGGGLFTQTVIQALTTRSVDADYNQNNYVEFMEMVDYVQTAIQDSGEDQTPWLARREMFGDFPLTQVVQ